MNIRKNEGITLTTLVVTIVLILIVSGISITGTLTNHKETEEASQISELNIIQHAILERYTKAQLTKETLETLPGTTIEKDEVEKIISEINNKAGEKVNLKGTEYKQLNTADLENLGVTKEDDTFIVNYKTGEVINASKKVTKSGKALYIYAKNE